VVWRGFFAKLTHTECVRCGAKNCQIIETDDDNDEPGEEEHNDQP